jgi:hypothetical protein
MNCETVRSQIANSRAAPGPLALQLSLGAGLSAIFLVVLFPDEKVLLVHLGRASSRAASPDSNGLTPPGGNDVRFQFQRTIVFETRAYISYNLKFVY